MTNVGHEQTSTSRDPIRQQTLDLAAQGQATALMGR
jgi:hypothetical protein